MSNFRDWKLTDLENRFQLRRKHNLAALETWLNGEEEISDFEKSTLAYFSKNMFQNVLFWNKQELAMHFIGAILTLVNFTSCKSNLYGLREISGKVDEEEMSGSPDGMIAAGLGEPEVPYFCFFEYEKDCEPTINPIGPCLAAMLVAQSKNEENLPIYGVTIVGENWRFWVLEGRNYDISGSYSGGVEKIYDIFRILKRLKRIVAVRVGVEI